MIEASDEFFETYGLRVIKSLQRIIRALDIHSRKLNNDFQVTAPQLLCLYSLVKKGQMTQSALSKKLSMGISTINGVIDRLEKKDLVVRKRDTEDRRKVFVIVTKAGKDLADSAPSLLQESFSNALRQLPDLEQAAIALSLERVVELMEAKHLDAYHNTVPNSQINDILKEAD